MRRIFLPFTVMLSVVVLLASCLDDDVSETVYPSDAAITAFSLGTLNCYRTVKSSKGVDSTYKSNVTGSAYKFYIDQLNRTIYNPDSLPFGTDVAHVICTIASKNSGSVVIKNVDSDTLKYYNSTDSIDFTVPRQISVYSLDGTNHVDYTVSVNVHHEKPDSFIWHPVGSHGLFANARDMKALQCGDRMLVFVDNGNYGSICSSDISDGENWSVLGWNVNMQIPASACRNVVEKGGYVYLYTSRMILRTADGETWEQTGSVLLDRLVAASSSRLYAIDKSGNIVSTADDGMTWDKETLDSNIGLLPTQDISYCCIQSRVNPLNESVVLIGNRDADSYFSDSQAQVWSKLVDLGDNTAGEPWMYINPNDVDTLALPRLASLTTVKYNGGLLAAGSHGIGACSTEGFKKFYVSLDGGIYWNESKNCVMPDGFECGPAFTMAVDNNDYLWIFCSTTGQVWRGRFSGVSSKKDDTSFTK